MTGQPRFLYTPRGTHPRTSSARPFAPASRPQDLREAGIRTLQKIGDCDVPGAVVHATYAGHPLAREFDANVAPMLFERATVPETVSPDSQRNR